VPSVPTLAEVLDDCAGLLVNIEVKNLPGDADFDPDDRAAHDVVALLAARGRRDSVIVSSFNLAAIDCVHALDPDTPTGFLVLADFPQLDALAITRERGHRALHPFRAALQGEAGAALVERAHDAGIALNVWTVNDEPEVAMMVGLGVDAIITDVPGAVRRILAAAR
jgi:glycerophosphoryl diester phosphodiesterase